MEERPEANSVTVAGALPGGSESLRVDLIDATGRLSGDECRWLIDRVSGAFAEACRRESSRSKGIVRGGEVRIQIVGDDEMSRLHEEYAGVSGTTDVLTFDLSGDEENGKAPPLDVDLTACLDEAERQAAARGGTHRREHELLLYSLHGLLHCLGHDDHEDATYRLMHETEDQILSAIGVGALFGSAPAAPKAGGAP